MSCCFLLVLSTPNVSYPNDDQAQSCLVEEDHDSISKPIDKNSELIKNLNEFIIKFYKLHLI